MRKRKYDRSNISPKQYVTEYMKAFKRNNSIGEFAQKIGMSKNNAIARMNFLKKKGLKLPKLRDERGKYDLEELKAIIELGGE